MVRYESEQFKANRLLSFLLLLAGILFAPYLLLASGMTLFSAVPLSVASVIGMWRFYLSWLLLARVEGYALICIVFIVLPVVAMIWGRPSPGQRVGLLLILGLVLFFMLAPYRPAIQAATGYQMVVPTAPDLFMRGLRNAQAVAEVVPCRYRLLGWQQETLFYQSTCENAEVRTWQFSPETMKQPVEHRDAAPQNLDTHALSHEATLAHVIAKDVRPVTAEYSVRSLYVPEPGLLSPSGKWLALISQHLYSTQDVTLIQQE